MKRHTLTVMLAALIILPLSVSVFADTEEDSEFPEDDPIPVYVEGSESEVGDGSYKGYNLYYKYPNQFTIHNDRSWWWTGSNKSGFTVNWVGDGQDYTNATIKVPDKINRTDVIGIKGSCNFKAFDLNPENKYMKCVDNVIFSKDGKMIIAYAQFDTRREYVVPEGTEIIGCNAIWSCRNLHIITIPNSVNEIMDGALASANYNLTLVNFYDFDVKIDRGAFSTILNQSNLMLKSGVTVLSKSKGNTISWDSISNASYYEIYQKLRSGEYTLLGKTKSTSHSFTALKSGIEYTFAVKPIAVIPAANYDKEKDEDRYPKTFTIEGTMSEDITVTGK